MQPSKISTSTSDSTSTSTSAPVPTSTTAPAPALPTDRSLTAVHVTHEAVDHMGGIGTVLEGLLTSKVYQGAVKRSIFVGPLAYADRRVADPLERLGDFGTVCLYSGPENYDPVGWGAIFKPVEWAFGVRIVYGIRNYRQHSAGGLDGREINAEVLMIDVMNPNQERLGAFKWFLFEKYGIDSRLFEGGWDFEEWCRLADPAYHALCALLDKPGAGKVSSPAVVFSHEFMGMCTALRCAGDRERFRTLFHAHECATARRIVENIPGHDVAFYPMMRAAMKEGKNIEDVFGDQSDSSRHALVKNTFRLDAVLAVGPETGEELRFLSLPMRNANVKIAYNGLPAPTVTAADKLRSRKMVLSWLKSVAGFEPDYLITHVTRPVISKGLWRDMKVCWHLRERLAEAGKRAVYLLLTCGAVPRSTEQVTLMSQEYGWPLQHRDGYPDLDGPELGIARMIQGVMGYTHQHVHAMAGAGAGGAGAGGSGRESEGPAGKKAQPSLVAMLVNQFGFSRERLGASAPAEMTIDDLRRAADAEFGMSVYEPYGIAHLEALHAGAICMPSTVCGCLGLVTRAMAQEGLTAAECPVVLPAEFTAGSETDAHGMTAHTRDMVEETICEGLADELFARLPKTESDRERLLALGQRLSRRMSWDAVCEAEIIPAMREVVAKA